MTFQRSGPITPGRGEVSSGGIRGYGGVLQNAAYVGLRRRWGGSRVGASSN